MISAAVNPVTAITVPRTPLLIAVLLSAWAFAQAADNLDPSITIDDLQKQEILSSAGDWRKPEVVEEEEWRDTREKPKPAERSRMQFGYESIYDDARIRQDDPISTTSPDLEKYKPSTMFKVTF